MSTTETPSPPEPVNDGAMAVVHWRITGHSAGSGRAVPVRDALAERDRCNVKYGDGTHWIVEVTA